MKTLPILVVLLLALSGCDKKSDVFMFDCVVYDQKVDAPVSGASIIMKVQNATGGFNPTFVTVGSAITDANGRFYIEVEKGVYFSYRLEITDSKHFNGTFDINPDDVPFSTAYSSTFPLEPRAWVSTRLVNQNSSQTATFRIDAETGNCTDCCQSSSGLAVSLTIVRRMSAESLSGPMRQASTSTVAAGQHPITQKP